MLSGTSGSWGIGREAAPAEDRESVDAVRNVLRRGRGYGAALAHSMLSYSDTCGVSVMPLNTRDARGFYEKLGFRGLPSADRTMWRSVSAAGADAI